MANYIGVDIGKKSLYVYIPIIDKQFEVNIIFFLVLSGRSIDIERLLNFKITSCKFSDRSGSFTDNSTNWLLNPDVADVSSDITENSVDLLHLLCQPYMVFLEIPYRLANPATTQPGCNDSSIIMLFNSDVTFLPGI